MTDQHGGEADSTASFIGIIVAISGNVLISLALNCQKLAHRRLDRERRAKLALDESRIVPPSGERRATSTINRRIPTDIEEAEDDDDDDDERTRVGGSSQHQSPNSDAESGSGIAIPFPVSASGSRPDTPSPAPAPRGPSLRDTAHSILLESQPLLLVSDRDGSVRSGYGTSIEIGTRSRDASSEAGRGSWREPAARTRGAPHLLTRMFSRSRDRRVGDDTDLEAFAVPVDVRVNVTGSGYSTPSGSRAAPRVKFSEPKVHEENESDYLKSKLWWLGFILMCVGEIGNFISYGFAPASVVAPLGTFALIANCFFAPLILKERFRKRDLLGMLLAIIGAATVVISASSSDRRLDPDALVDAITQRAFIILTVVYAVGVAVLVSMSSQRIGQKHVWVDVGACAFFGGFTVLSTKAFSSLLTREWIALFKEWITYPVLAVLIGTGFGQIRYLNRALMKFDSKIVIPSQFVLFNISAIVGSAVLYGDFRRASFHQMMTFLYGCGTTFAGVVMLTWGPVEHTKDLEEEARAEQTGRAQLVLPVSTAPPPRPAPVLRAKTSSITLSPAQRALLVRTLSEDMEEDS